MVVHPFALNPLKYIFQRIGKVNDWCMIHMVLAERERVQKIKWEKGNAGRAIWVFLFIYLLSSKGTPDQCVACYAIDTSQITRTNSITLLELVAYVLLYVSTHMCLDIFGLCELLRASVGWMSKINRPRWDCMVQGVRTNPRATLVY